MSTGNEDPEIKKSLISEKLIEALSAYYKPAETPVEADETKSTQDLINEMSDMEEIYPYEVNRLMETRGFKIYYTGTNFVWLLKVK